MSNTMPSRIGVALLASAIEYHDGPIHLFLAVTNVSPNPLRLVFGSDQQYDFALLNHKGDEYWRWSKGRVFDPTESEIIVPAGKFHVFTLSLENLPIPPNQGNTFALEGALTSESLPFVGRMVMKLV